MAGGGGAAKKKTCDVLEVTFGDKLQKNGIMSKGIMFKKFTSHILCFV